MAFKGRELRSTLKDDGTLTLSLETAQVGDPGDDEIVVRIEAAPINPSDLGLLLGPADIATLSASGGGDHPELRFEVPKARLGAFKARLGESMAVGNEGAGIVVAAGRNVANLEGKRVGMVGGAMFADYRRIRARDVIPLPEGASSADGA